jgi:hypothetical protein
MAIYRKNDDQFPLFDRAKKQEAAHTKSEADSGGYIVGLNPDLKVSEVESLGDLPVSAKGMRMGANAKHWLKDMKNK